MVPQRSGSVVLVGSQLAQVGAPGYASYCAVKGGVEALVRALAVDFGPSGIRVNSLAPGVVQTPLAYVDRPDFDDQVDAIASRLPLRRIGQPDDMAGPAVFLLSDDSAWMTGQSLVVDGGYIIQCYKLPSLGTPRPRLLPHRCWWLTVVSSWPCPGSSTASPSASAASRLPPEVHGSMPSA